MTTTTTTTTATPKTSIVISLIISLIITRTLVGFHPYSGQGDDHDGTASYGGDYEAQRHWMEITLHLPVTMWYYYDLSYWGLDYPPLTSYHSLLCGYLSSIMVGDETVRLYDSRGYENDLTHKAFMRGSVLVGDVLVYFTAVGVVAWELTRRRRGGDGGGGGGWEGLMVLGLALLQPGMILIDHGHFQYNTIALGLSLWSFYYVTKNNNNNNSLNFINAIIGSVLFCLALNFKQMTLYYAPSIFAYLLGKCFRQRQSSSSSQNYYYQPFFRFVALGLTVLFTFGILWYPFVKHSTLPSLPLTHSSLLFNTTTTTPPPISLTPTQNILQIIKRLFPFQRGLFENKVSNIWCALSTKPFNIRERIPMRLQPIMALIVTLVLIMPSCVRLFCVGRRRGGEGGGGGKRRDGGGDDNEDDLRELLWGSGVSALGFFLGSFQVHEKSILIPLAPLSLLITDQQHSILILWFSVTASWTLYPLMKIDNLQLAYITTMIIFISVAIVVTTLPTFKMTTNKISHDDDDDDRRTTTRRKGDDFLTTTMLKITHYGVIPLSYIVMLLLHLGDLVIEAPANLPDLFAVLWSIVGCALFGWFWLMGSLILWKGGGKEVVAATTTTTRHEDVTGGRVEGAVDGDSISRVKTKKLQ